MTLAQSVVKQLKRLGVRYVFGIPGGPWIPYMSAMKEEGIDFILVSNETSAGFMADVTFRLTGVPGVCHGTFGPGATNLSTGVGGGLLDRSALIAITSEIPRAWQNRTIQMNVDHQALFRPLTKETVSLDERDPAGCVFRAMEKSLSLQPGPVHIGAPSDLGGTACDAPPVEGPLSPEIFPQVPEKILEDVASRIGKADRPVIAVGLTAARLGLREEITALADRLGAPVVITPMAKGILPLGHPSYQGVLFHALSWELARVIGKADLVLGVGYDPIEFNYEPWMPESLPLVSVDEVPADIDRTLYSVEGEAVGDLKSSLERLIPRLGKSRWTGEELAEVPGRIKSLFDEKAGTFGPVSAVRVLRDVMEDDGLLTLDVGAHLHLCGQLWDTYGLNQVFMTNGWSSMGYAMPAAVAAKLNCPGKQVACVTGDGGFLMMAGEIVTARRLGLNVVFVVFADRELSLIAVKQDWRDVERYGTDLYRGEYLQADSFLGVPVLRAGDDASLRESLERGFSLEGPVVVEVVLEGDQYKDLIAREYK